ncbi:HIV Tat-specific factor 1 homolog [Copidosoma floridanum]|uniref:HIV Tat-specific factor 1 homolog n=1 Tax=Copidosoma floridanum TaxID=29053 RepID=UPI0006C9BED7|nr:HIV Tat-specific factor 1 homolog [Copidosoma floridanum]
MSEQEIDIKKSESAPTVPKDGQSIKSNDCDSNELNQDVSSRDESVDGEGAHKQENKIDEPKVLEQSTLTIPYVPPKPLVKEIPKVNYKKRDDDDIEEFDTDEEEETNAKEQHSYTNNISYEGGQCVYTEPGTGRKLVWNSAENKWCPKEENSDTSNPMKDYEFDGKHYVYTDKNTKVTYKFIQEKNEWVVKNDDEVETGSAVVMKDKADQQTTAQGVYGFENDTHTYTDPADGTSYFWDKEKNAWFPKLDDDFMARYQMNYGFTGSNSTSSTNEPSLPSEDPPKPPQKPKLTKEERKAENKRKAKEAPTWFDVDEKHNLTVYISNLPLDITMDELKELVCKCGLLARDEKGVDKLKLYADESGDLKGDARCTYIKLESVELALDILDGWNIRGKTLSVQRAKFQLKGEYDPSKKPKRKNKDKDKQKKIHDKLLDWRPDKMLGEPLKCERVVILKNLFQPEDFDKDPKLILEFTQDIRSECVKCGEVKKVTLYDRNPEGVAQVTFKEIEEAQACIELLNGRWFGQRKITAEIWDGRTKYKIKETEEQIEARMKKWDDYLDGQDGTESKTAAENIKSTTGDDADTNKNLHSQSSVAEAL